MTVFFFCFRSYNRNVYNGWASITLSLSWKDQSIVSTYFTGGYNGRAQVRLTPGWNDKKKRVLVHRGRFGKTRLNTMRWKGEREFSRHLTKEKRFDGNGAATFEKLAKRPSSHSMKHCHLQQLEMVPKPIKPFIK